jgi:hypothetical protein
LAKSNIGSGKHWVSSCSGFDAVMAETCSSAKKKALNGYPRDLVGDVHGHADPLHRLLDKLDYTEVEGRFPAS